MKKRNVTITWYDDPAEAERDLRLADAKLTPEERVEQTMRLMVLCGTWDENGSLKGTPRILDIPRG